MTVYENYDVIAFKSCIQIFTVYQKSDFILKCISLNYFQRAISYICNTNGDIICQNGWMEPVDTDDRDPLSPCSEPICSNGCEHGTCVSPDW